MTAVMGQVSDLAYRVSAVIDRRYSFRSGLNVIPRDQEVCRASRLFV